MKNLTSVVLFASICTMLSCNKADLNNSNLKISSDYSDTVTIRMNETVMVGDESSTLTFNEVIEDSRCPVDVVCIWAGNAKASFTFSTLSGDEVIFLNTIGDNQMPSDTTINGFRIKLTELTPSPISTSEIKSDSYEATIIFQLEN